MMRLLVGHAIGIFSFALLQGNGFLHSGLDAAIITLFAILASAGRGSREARSGAVAMGLLTSSAVLVHLWDGAIEAHFHFFVMIAVLTLYEDWVPFLLAAAFVLLHHGVAGVLAPESVYGHAAAIGNPLPWALIHAVFVTGAGAANVLSWKLHEQTRAHAVRLATIVECSEDAILSVDTEGRIVSWNRGAHRLFGWQAQEIIGRPLTTLIPTARLHEDTAVSACVRRGEHLEHVETTRRAKDGSEIAVSVSASPMRGPDGSIVGASAIMQDITDRRLADEALRRERRRLTEAETIGQMGNWEWEVACDRVTWSPQLFRLFGLDPATFEANLDAYMSVVHAADRGVVGAIIGRALETGVFEPFEHRYVRNGEVRHMLARGQIVTDDDGQVVRMIGTGMDITDRKLAEKAVRQSQEALAYQALHDALTGLPNRSLLESRLEHALARGRRTGARQALIFLDVDRFKVINDSLGHHVGDELLVELAGRLEHALRPSDTVARFGGDEFVMLCEDVDSDEVAMTIAERILEAAAEPVVLAGREHVMTVSLGVVLSSADCSAESLLRDADVAMYCGKERGRARYELFDAEMRQRSLERMQIENELRQAVGDGQLRLHYQPMVSLDDGTITAVEALVRWEHPERGTLGPAAFIPIAEESPLILAVGAWVLEEACRQIGEWEDQLGPDFYVSVNVSPRQVAAPDFVDTVRRALGSSGTDPRRLAVEVTETALMEQEAAAASLMKLRKLGVRILLDDFGTGYSSLSYLGQLPLHGLKIDRSFVAQMAEGTAEQAIVAAVGTMAAALRLNLVAEGVETEAQRTTLLSMGYTLGQGHLFSCAVPPEVLFPHADRSRWTRARRDDSRAPDTGTWTSMHPAPVNRT